jgi:multidrug resistance protein, MATE family
MVASYYPDLDHLAALGLGNAFLLVIIQSFSYGFASGLNTMVAYSFNDQQYYSVGLHLNRALIINTLIYVLQIWVMFFCRPILSLLKQDDEVIELTAQYILIMLVGMYGKIQFETIRWYLLGKLIRFLMKIKYLITQPN